MKTERILCAILVVALAMHHSHCQELLSDWEFDSYLKASNSKLGYEFGHSVAAYGNTLVVGSQKESSSATGINGDQQDMTASNSGAVYIFVRSGTTWTQQAYIKASNTDAGDGFGISVGIYGDTVVVGADGESSAPGDPQSATFSNSGAAYIFTREGDTWSQDDILKAGNIETNARFGWCVAIDGDTVVVGTLYEAGSSGTVYVFTRSEGMWIQQDFLKASNTENGDFFGYSVAIYGDTVVVGAVGEDSDATGVDVGEGSNAAQASGAAYIFTRSGISWSQQAYLKANNTEANDNFGYSVAIYGDAVVVGAILEGSISGAAYVFTRNGTTWTQLELLKSSNFGNGDQFGCSVAMEGYWILVGACFEDSNGTGIDGVDNDLLSNSGAAYLFTLGDSTVSQVAYIKAPHPSNTTQFGSSVALSSQFAIVGAVKESSAATGVNGDQLDTLAPLAGAAYAYQVNDGLTTDSSTAGTGSSLESDTTADGTTSGVTTEAESSPDDPTSISSVVISIAVIFPLLALICFALVILLLWRRRHKGSDTDSDIDLSNINHNVDLLQNVTLKEVIGKGAFGEVYLGDCDGTPCACKKLTSSDAQEAIREAKTLFKLSHPNIVRLIGIYIDGSNDTYLVLEYVKGGSLTSFLPKKGGLLTVSQLVNICIGIAQGMAYLERKGIVHRDLAARNVLLNEDAIQPMISDFGMSRDTLYQRSSTSKIPVKWTAPEVIQQGNCTSKSDVFSFGIVLWEIFSFAVMPFNGLSNDEAAAIICDKDITGKMKRPTMCPDKLYQLMIRCWSFEPAVRPSFQDALTELLSINADLPQEQPVVIQDTSSGDHYN